MAVNVGDRFRVSAVTEWRDRRERLIARFLPAFEYRITPRNLQFVAGLFAAGEAVPAEGAGDGLQDLAAATSKVAGKVAVKS